MRESHRLCDGHCPTSRENLRSKRKRVAFFGRVAAESGIGPTVLTPDDVVFQIFTGRFVMRSRMAASAPERRCRIAGR
jgi:hypothetical protein